MKEIILINVSGHDRPGITAALSAILARGGVNVLDIGQAVIHDNLAWGMLIEVPPERESAPVIRDLVFKAHELGLDVRFTPIPVQRYEDWVVERGQPRHIITLLAPRITATHFAWIAELTTRHNLNIDLIQRLSGRLSLDARDEAPNESRGAAVEFRVKGVVEDMPAMRAAFLHGSREFDVDVAIQDDSFYRRNRRLVCFDMDSTLVRQEVIDELAGVAGVKDQVAAITAAAMRGEIDFRESFTRRVALLEGLEVSVLPRIADALHVTEGAERLITTLKRYGYKIAILSGGFGYFARYLQERLGIDYVYANELEIADGRLTGKATGEIVDEAKKAELLKRLAAQEGVHLEQVIAVGDGANDLPMLSIAGLGVAYRAKPLVKSQARYSLDSAGLDSILYLVGMRSRDFADV